MTGVQTCALPISRYYYETNRELKQVIDQLSEGYFSPNQPDLFQPIVKTLMDRDEFFVLADYAPYIKTQEAVAKAYLDQERWTKMAILNVARSGKFSTDRAIKEYAEGIWGLVPVTQ